MQKKFNKLLCCVLAVSIASTSLFCFGLSSYAEDESTTAAQEATTAPGEEGTTLSEEELREQARRKLESQKAALEADLQAAEAKIAELSAASKNTEEYINALDAKIGVLNEQLTVLDNQVTAYQEDIDILQKDIDENQKQADALQAEVDRVQAILDELTEKFNAVYDAYCVRMRAIYISGSYNLITALLTCKDISGFLTRYEMIRAVSKSDAELLEEIQKQTEEIMRQESDLNDKKMALDDIKTTLLSEQNEQKNKQEALTRAQEEIASKKIILAQDRAESDELFAKLTAQNGMYTEFRNEDKAITEAVEKEIEGLIAGIIKPEDVSEYTTGSRDDVTAQVQPEVEVYNKSDAALSMTYPVPGHTATSAGFPNYSNGSYHGGIDFPCPKGSKVVAAQKGVVLTVKRLNYSYGYYVMIYHGTDSKGRTVVTLYAHNSSILVSPGQTVTKGQQIAASGSTGNSTGPHCHFEVRLNGTRVNPKNYIM